MKKVFTGIALGLLLAWSCYYAVILFDKESISDEYARVTVKNKSGRTVKRVMILYNSGGLEATGLNNNEEVRFVFNNTSENSYKTHVIFEDDSELVSKEVYFEYGYRGTETITSTGIVTENNWMKK